MLYNEVIMMDFWVVAILTTILISIYEYEITIFNNTFTIIFAIAALVILIGFIFIIAISFLCEILIALCLIALAGFVAVNGLIFFVSVIIVNKCLNILRYICGF